MSALNITRVSGVMVGPTFITNVPVILTRLTEAWSQDLSGKLYRFGVDVPRQTNRGRQISGAATRLHGMAREIISSWPATITTLADEGFFGPFRVASTGATWHRGTVRTAITSGTPYYQRVRVRRGSSNKIYIELRNDTGGTSSVIMGSFDAPTITSVAAGPITALVNRLVSPNVREFTFTWVPNFTSDATNTLGVGPNSIVTGEYIDVLGMQVASSFTDWIMGGAGTKAIAADIMSLNLTGLDMTAGFMLRMDGIVDATPRVGFDRFYQADDGVADNRSDTAISSFNANIRAFQLISNVVQGDVVLASAITPPVAFSLVGAHGVNYTGGAFGGSVATPDTVAGFVTPNRLFIGSNGASGNLPMTLTAIRLVPGAPTTALVTGLAA